MKITLPLLVLLLGAPCLAVPVSVLVVDDKGAPVAGADVQLQSFAQSPKGTEMELTNAQGVASFEVEPAKSESSFVGYVAVWKNEFALGGGTLMLKTPLKVVLQPSNSVSGIITDDEKRPIAGATVRFSSYRSPGKNDGVYLSEGPLQEKMQAVSGADGSWKINHIPPDVSVGVAIRATGRANGQARILTGSSAQTALPPGATIEGRLIGLDNKPLAGVRVYARQMNRDIGSRSYADDKTGEDGTFKLSGLLKGNYRVGFSPSERADKETFVVATVDNVAATPEKAVQLPDARAVAGVLIGGQVVSSDTKTPLGGVVMGMQGDDNPDSWHSATTDEKGRWQIRTLEKSGKLYVQMAPREFVRNEQQRIPFVAGTDNQNLNFELARATKITGRLVDENGRGVQTNSLVLRQKYEEYPLQSDENGNFLTFGPKDGEFEVGRPRWNHSENDAPQWDIVGTSKFSLPSLKPLEIKLKRAELSRVELGVFDQDDASLQGVKVVVTVSIWNGNTGTSSPKELISDKTGRVHLEGIRSDETVAVQSATKEGYDLAPVPKLEKVNGVYEGAITLTRRSGAARGQVFDAQGAVAPSTSLFASGIETTSDATGQFSIAPLPKGKTEVIAWKGSGFALGSSDATRLELKPQTLEPTNAARAKEVIDALRDETKATKYWRRDSLNPEAVNSTFDADVQQATANGNGRGIYRLILRYGADQSIPSEKWATILQTDKSPSNRLYNAALWSSTASSVVANDATRAWLLALEGDAAQVEKQGGGDRWQNAIGLFGVAALAERLGETDKADELFERANAFVQRNFPEKGDNNNNPSQDTTFGVMGEIIAVSPRLLTKLVALVETDSSAYSRLLKDGTPVVARLAGLDAARPFLDQLKKAPQPKPDSQGNSSSIEWATQQAVMSSIRAGGKSNPKVALELAQSLPKSPRMGDGNWRGRALSEAAFFQTPEVAQTLWRDSLPQLEPGSAMRFIARIAENNEPLAREFYETIRQNLDAQPEVDENAMIYNRQSQTAVFAFYEARFNPARARYRLEKGFQKARKDQNSRYELDKYARAMAVLDTERALSWAEQIGNADNNFAGFEAKRSIARWLSLDEAARRKVNFGDRLARDEDF